ncbi:glycosyltransferase family 2 protein [uncultured Clostridium sp.]|jgi:cellulose synthase/poly-beta-1,6-N-acetylglucosamine synthase-like glycosyltransferase|uniref:glycosyltransferase n=1 Tax=uncultured Clostridium sp. TaxID=59620 RepID=UPI0026196C65|nr:glycosyltransferase family 2 protein [uncultured Clostridium sp.]
MIFDLVVRVISYIVLVVFLYNIVITMFSLKIKKKNESIKIEDKNTFCVLIPCHNEEEVIESTLNAINKTIYDKSLCKVYVIADNCSDTTSEVCEAFIKNNPLFDCRVLKVRGGSKPKALNSAVNILKEEGLWTADNIVILDADNKVSPTIFNSFNEEHLKGEKLVQCAIKSLNDVSFVARGFTSAFNNMNRGFQYARNRVGLSGSLSGTGFSIDRKVWDEVDFIKCDTLTEDLEFSILSILAGYRVKFVFDDYVLNQHLDEFKPSMVQRVRWSRGHMQVFMKLSWSVIKEFLKNPSIQLIDSFLFITNPFRDLLYVVVLFIDILLYKEIHVPLYLILIPLTYSIVFTILCDNRKIKYLLPSMMYTVTMFFATVYGGLTYTNRVWAKTVHKKIELPAT